MCQFCQYSIPHLTVLSTLTRTTDDGPRYIVDCSLYCSRRRIRSLFSQPIASYEGMKYRNGELICSVKLGASGRRSSLWTRHSTRLNAPGWTALARPSSCPPSTKEVCFEPSHSRSARLHAYYMHRQLLFCRCDCSAVRADRPKHEVGAALSSRGPTRTAGTSSQRPTAIVRSSGDRLGSGSEHARRALHEVTHSDFTKYVACKPKIAYLPLRPARPEAPADASNRPGGSFGSMSHQPEQESAGVRMRLRELRNGKELLQEVTSGGGQTLVQ